MGRRIVSGILGGAVFIGLGLLGGVWLSLGLGALILLGVFEFGRLCRTGAFRFTVQVPAVIGLTMLLVITVRLHGATTLAQVRGAESILGFFAVFLFLGAGIVEVFRGQIKGALTATGLSVLAGVYISYPMTYMLLLRSLPGKDGLFYFFLLTIVTWANDSCAYFAGSALGRHRLAPLLSPQEVH